jgi:hypothetical protein
MSYRNPKQILDTKYANINAGLKNMFSAIGDTAEDFAKYKKVKEATAKARVNSRMSGYEKQEAAFRKLALDVGDDIVSDEERQSYTAQVEENLKLIRDNLARELSNQDLSNSEISQYQTLALRDLGTFQQQLTQWQLATNEYQEAKKKKWNEPGALLSGKNNESIEMLGNIMDDGKENFFLFNRTGADYKLGSGNWAIGMMDDVATPGVTPNMTNVVMFDEIVKTPDGESFFNTTGSLPDNNLKQFKKTIDTFIQNKDDRFVTNGKIDKQKLSTYLSNSPDGDKLIKSMFDNPNDSTDKSNYLGYLRGKAGALTEDVEDLGALDEQMLSNRDILIESLIADAYPFEQLDNMEIKENKKSGKSSGKSGGKGSTLSKMQSGTTTNEEEKEEETLDSEIKSIPKPKTDAQKADYARIIKAQKAIKKYETTVAEEEDGVVEGDYLKRLTEQEEKLKKAIKQYYKKHSI